MFLGAATHGFRSKGQEYNYDKYNQAHSFSIIGAERTIDVQLPYAFLQSAKESSGSGSGSGRESSGGNNSIPKRTSSSSNTSITTPDVSVYFTRGLSTSSNNSDHSFRPFLQSLSPDNDNNNNNNNNERRGSKKHGRPSFTEYLANSFRMSTGSTNSEYNSDNWDLGSNTMNRDWLVDMLSLLALQMLEPGEAKLRRRQYRRAHMLKQFAKGDSIEYDKPTSANDQKEARKMQSILIKSLKVDEEILNSNISRTSSRTLWYSEEERL